MGIFLASIPRCGTRWLRDSIGEFQNIPWLTSVGDLGHRVKSSNRTAGHHPPFPDILASEYVFVYLRRKSIPDQITSFANHPHEMILPEYLDNHKPYTRIENSIRIMAQFYPMMKDWRYYAFTIYYEDLCDDFEKAITPFCKAASLDARKIAARSKTQTRHVNKGCAGIGQSSIWTGEEWALYKELFNET